MNHRIQLLKILNTLLIFFFTLNLTAFAKPKEHNMNPLLTHGELPDFNAIKPEHFDPSIDALIKSFNNTLNNVNKVTKPVWTNTIQKLDEEGARLSFARNVIGHLNAVNNIDEIRKAYEAILPKLSNFYTDLSQNKELYALYQNLRKGEEFNSYSDAQKTTIDNAIRNFKDAGIDLNTEKKVRLKEINNALSELSNNFSKNVIDATQSWSYHIATEKEALLDGLPKHIIDAAIAKAKTDGKDGWILTLDYPCYEAVMSYAKDRDLREIFYRAYSTRASQEAEAKQFDNSGLIDKILTLRQEKAQLIGYKNYAEYSLSPKMADTTKEVMDFLTDLADRSKPQGIREIASLKPFAQEHDGITNFSPWDYSYYSTYYKKIHFNFSEEDLRPYFPEDKVFKGLFDLANRLYEINIKEVKDFSKWNEHVRLFEIYDNKQNLSGKFYVDLFTRNFKQSGAWQSGLTSRMKHSGLMQIPVAFLVTNFPPSNDDKLALFSHNEIKTLFHEFGHMLHHTLTMVDYPSVAGTNVPWDAVELPSQFMENWTYVWEVVESMSEHIETGKPLPKGEFDKLIAVKNYNSAITMLRQLEFALFDFRIHMRESKDSEKTVGQVLDDVRSEVSVLSSPSYNRFQNSFSHIFAGGYASGYYSYKWAEVLSSDAFSKFEEDGMWHKETGQLFLKSILEQGGSRKPIDLFVEFRGREPKIDALLKHSGIE